MRYLSNLLWVVIFFVTTVVAVIEMLFGAVTHAYNHFYPLPFPLPLFGVVMTLLVVFFYGRFRKSEKQVYRFIMVVLGLVLTGMFTYVMLTRFQTVQVTGLAFAGLMIFRELQMWRNLIRLPSLKLPRWLRRIGSLFGSGASGHSREHV